MGRALGAAQRGRKAQPEPGPAAPGTAVERSPPSGREARAAAGAPYLRAAPPGRRPSRPAPGPAAAAPPCPARGPEPAPGLRLGPAVRPWLRPPAAHAGAGLPLKVPCAWAARSAQLAPHPAVPFPQVKAHARPRVAPVTKTFLEAARDGTDGTRNPVLFSDRCPG